MCKINLSNVECLSDSGAIISDEVVVEERGEIIFNLDGLEPNTRYTCRARLENSEFGDEFEFITSKL